MKPGPHIGLAVAVGYVLGRRRRTKLALVVGTMMAGRRLSADPRQLLDQGTKLATSSPQLAKLVEQVREQLLEAAKNAAMAAATNKIDSLGESLTKRADRLTAGAPGTEEAGEAAREQFRKKVPQRVPVTRAPKEEVPSSRSETGSASKPGSRTGSPTRLGPGGRPRPGPRGPRER